MLMLYMVKVKVQWWVQTRLYKYIFFYPFNKHRLLAATIDTTSYTNTSQKYYEEDVDDDEEDDDYDLDDVYADDGYEDELFPQKTRHATVTYRGSSFKDTLYIGCEKFPQHDFYPINASGVM